MVVGFFMNFKKVIFIQCLFLTTFSLFGPRQKPINIDEVPAGSQSIFDKIRQAHPETPNPPKKKKPRTSAPFSNDSPDSGISSLTHQSGENKSKFAINKALPVYSEIKTGSKASAFERLRGLPSRDSVENFNRASLNDLSPQPTKLSFKNVKSTNNQIGMRQPSRKKPRKYSKKAEKEEIPSVEKADADLKSIKDTVAESISNALMAVRQDVKSSDGNVLSYGRTWSYQELEDYNESREIWAEDISDERISRLKELGEKYLSREVKNDLLIKLENSDKVRKKAIDKDKEQPPTPEETFSKIRRQISQPLEITDVTDAPKSGF